MCIKRLFQRKDTRSIATAKQRLKRMIGDDRKLAVVDTKTAKGEPKKMTPNYANYQCPDCGHIEMRVDVGAGTLAPCSECLSVLGSYRIGNPNQNPFHTPKKETEHGTAIIDRSE